MGSNLNTCASIEECPQGLRDDGLISENVPQGMSQSGRVKWVWEKGETSLTLGFSCRAALGWVRGRLFTKISLTPNVLVTKTSPYLL